MGAADLATEREAAMALARDLLGGPVDGVAPIRHGRNSRVFRVTAGGDVHALKHYPAPGTDTRDRLGTEVEALRLMEQCGIGRVARVVAVDAARNVALLSWLDGAPVDAIADADIDAAAAFLDALHAMRRAPAARTYARPASEACLSGREAETQVRLRLAALRSLDGEPDLADFLDAAVAPAIDTHAAGAARAMAAAGLDFATPLPQELRTLAPSDFGFHNALRRHDGTLVFLDFEYFGWDDPVKLVADILHHPGLRLPAQQAARLRSSAVATYGADDHGFAARLAALYPLFGLRWVLILLNEFLPARWRQRVAAGDTAPWPHAKARQLARAREMFASMAPIMEIAAHG
jgi:hypothetical protein